RLAPGHGMTKAIVTALCQFRRSDSFAQIPSYCLVTVVHSPKLPRGRWRLHCERHAAQQEQCHLCKALASLTPVELEDQENTRQQWNRDDVIVVLAHRARLDKLHHRRAAMADCQAQARCPTQEQEQAPWTNGVFAALPARACEDQYASD